MNADLLKISNVAMWREKGITGEGIVVVIAEPKLALGTHGTKLVSLEDYISKVDMNDWKQVHSMNTIETLLFYAPGVTIYLWDYGLGKEQEMVDFALLNAARIINTSFGQNYPDGTFIEHDAINAYKQALDMGISINNSIGNKQYGEIVIYDNAYVDERVNNSGAVYKDGLLESYSCYDDKFTVDFCGLVGLRMSTGGFFGGTSEANPYNTAIDALMMQAFPGITDEEIMLKTCFDIEEEGVDTKSGKGLKVMPYDRPFSIRMYINGMPIWVHRDYTARSIKRGYTLYI